MEFSTSSSLLHRLHRASQTASERLSRELGSTDLTPRQIIVLAAVASDEGASQTDIVEVTGIDRSTMADIVRRLMNRGLLSRRRTKDDARAYSVKLTAQGAQMLASAEKVMARVDAEMLAAFPTTKRVELLNQLRILAEKGARCPA